MKNLAPAAAPLLLLLLLTACTETEDSRPNVLFLFADDQTYTALHALGNDEIQTPNLDRLV
ncbi:MAG: choline-sulfatase, partial [Bacteroidota bacterium]